ncbi:MAG: ABC transporter ATP-binding protein [Candidatus Krumholzibacteria bacterium]|nr:ABC transporter ATP-binding protein [Candidatus Krumholzibacteria bacterium]
MIRLRDVSFAFPGAAPRDFLDRLSLDVRDGEWVAVAGGNGSGKTTLCRLMAGISRPRAGSVEVDGADPACGRASAGGAPAVGIAFQNPDSQFVTPSVGREILFGMENLGIDPGEMSKRLAETARLFSVESRLSRNPHALSGGEKQRTLLACLWAMGPRHLILDEPFSFLDAPGRRAFLDALGFSFRREGKAIVWSTIDAGELEFADRVIYMEKGGVRFDGAPADLAGSIPRDDLERSLVHRASDTKSPSAGSRSAKPGGGVRPGDPGTAAIVEMSGARFSPGEDGFNLDISSLSIRSGERVGVCGPSGSGKTTLLLGCAGLLPPRSGVVSLFGRRVASRRDFPAGRAAFLFQSPEEGFFAPTVREEVGLAHRSLVGGAGEAEAVSRALNAVGLSPEEFLGRNTFRLSQGEKRLVALASVLVFDAELFILDEPTIFLDGSARRRLRSALDRLSARGATIVVASHDEDFLGECADRIVHLQACQR